MKNLLTVLVADTISFEKISADRAVLLARLLLSGQKVFAKSCNDFDNEYGCEIGNGVEFVRHIAEKTWLNTEYPDWYSMATQVGDPIMEIWETQFNWDNASETREDLGHAKVTDDSPDDWCFWPHLEAAVGATLRLDPESGAWFCHDKYGLSARLGALQKCKELGRVPYGKSIRWLMASGFTSQEAMALESALQIEQAA